MVTATVTFDVELTAKEARALDFLQRGSSTGRAATNMKMSLDAMQDLLAGIRFDKPFNLVEAVRERKVSLEFHDVAAIRKTA
jgi:hypothetical protein